VLEVIDGLVLVGGEDIGPANYGHEPHASTDPANVRRDQAELALTRGALARDMPVLGVCRGMEMLNVACGGTLLQHLEGELLTRHRHTPGVFSDHDVTLEPGSLAARAAGASHIAVRSHHHQAIGELGEGLVATGRCPDDDVLEAVELPGKRFALGVLWHPEEDEASGVIGALVSVAAGAKRAVALPQAPG
jgi:putative glutamine amidotransferase